MIIKANISIGVGPGEYYKPGDVFSINEEAGKRLLETGAAVKMERKVSVSIKTDSGDGNDN